MFECGGNKTFKNLEQCHEIQGEFKKTPLYSTPFFFRLIFIYDFEFIFFFTIKKKIFKLKIIIYNIIIKNITIIIYIKHYYKFFF